jgi:hypothetical protein
MVKEHPFNKYNLASVPIKSMGGFHKPSNPFSYRGRAPLRSMSSQLFENKMIGAFPKQSSSSLIVEEFPFN